MTSCIGDHFHHRCGLEDAFDDLCTKYLELCDRCGDLYDGNEAHNAAELDNLRANYKALSVQNDDLRAQLAHADAIIERGGNRNDELNRVKAQLAEADRAYEDVVGGLRAEVVELHEQLRVQNTSYRQLNYEHEGLRVSYEEMKQDFERRRELNERSWEQIKALRAECDQLRERYAYAAENNCELENQLEALRTECDNLRAKLKEPSYQRDYFELSASYDELKAKYEELVAYMKCVGCDDAAKLSAFNQVVALCTPYVGGA